MIRLRVVAAVLLASLGALLAPAGASAAERIIGGGVVDIGQAPFVVAVGGPSGVCTGSLLDASHVLTAGHCVYAHESTQAYAPGDMTVVAKTSTVPPLAYSATAESHAVAAIAQHPYFVQRPGQISPNDLAILTLASPVALDADAQPIAPGTGDGPLAPGRVAAIYGFGTSAAEPAPPDGRLRVQLTQLADDPVCGNDAPTILCTSNAASGTCPGDSGGPVVVAPRALAAVVAGARNAGCVVGNPGTNTDLSAGENGAWVAGNATPPRAPRYTGGARFTGQIAAGTTLTCGSGTWTGDGVAFSYAFLDAATGEVLQAGPGADRRLVDGDVGRSVACRIVASGPGGAGSLDLPAQRIVARASGSGSGSGTSTTPGTTRPGTPVPGTTVLPGTPPGAVAPSVRLTAPRVVRRGRRATIGVQVTAGPTAFTGARICVRLSGRATSRANRRSVCRTLSGPPAGGTTALSLRVRPARRGGVRVAVTARLGDGTTARGSITRRVR